MTELVARGLRRVQRHWTERGAWHTVRTIASTLFSPIVRYRQRLVYDIQLDTPREPSPWGSAETLRVFGPDNATELTPDVLETLDPDTHRTELNDVPSGNRLFAVFCGGRCIYRSYLRMVDRPSHDRTAVFFDGLEAIPEIRQAVMTTHSIPRELRGGLLKGLHTRVVNEQLRLLQSLGHRRAVLYIMAGNILSIRGNTAAGFRELRQLNDWIVLSKVVFQQIREGGRTRWRTFIQ